MDTPIEIGRALLWTCGCGLVLRSRLEQVLVLVEEIGDCGSTGMNLCTCGLVPVSEKDVCGGLMVWGEGETFDREGEAIWGKEAFGALIHGGDVFINGDKESV